MADTDTPASQTRKPGDLAPETHNAEQDERGEQAQDVAEEALDPSVHVGGGTESRKVPSPDYDNISGTETDLIDVMQNMEDTGVIDNGAFSGEPEHDDEAVRYRDTGEFIEGDEDEDDNPDSLHVTGQP